MSQGSPTPLSPLKRALIALDEMQATLDATRRAQREPIAIVGIGCRFPDGSRTPEEFWHALRDGVDAVREVPADRWDAAAYYDPDTSAPGKSYGRWGAFLDRVDQFDPAFFGIAPREAAGMDPQQRLLLEVAWEALEHAALSPAALSGTSVGVYVGITSGDYLTLQLQRNDLTQVDAYTLSGVAHSIAAGRLSYVLGLRGPSMAVDTACSSSLVAVHLACQSLRQAECRVAIAAGVHVTLSPINSVVFSKLKMLAADGRCKTFDARGDGFVEGEACAAVVLKRLSDATADGDRIIAVIRGSAVNQDGASSGLTAPNGPSQESVIRAALQHGEIRPSEVDYVEAHGTGTSLGDPIEVRALASVLGEGRAADRPLILGSVKTNIGHTQAAAGLAGLIKLALSLEREEIPPSLHFSEPNPHIPWGELPVRVAAQKTAWPRGASRRVGGVSSFGFSGTNVHVVVEEAPAPPAAEARADRPAHVLTLSARSDAALVQLASRWATALADQTSLADAAFTANTGRSHFEHRAAVVAESLAAARTQLGAIAAGAPAVRTFRGRLAVSDPPKLAMLCTGQGAQYAGMARELYEAHPRFRETLDHCAEVLRSELDRPLFAVLFPEPGQGALIDQTAYAQPALFAVEYALAELWKSWGVVPTAVLGHSLGEYVAACIAGVFTPEDGLRLVAARGRLMQALPPGGVMAAVFAPEADVRRAIAACPDQIAVAAVNGPKNVVISGTDGAVERMVAQFTQEDIACERLTVSHAFHSALMEPILDAFEQRAAAVPMSAPRLTVVSNLTGQPVRGELATAVYWRRHLRETVRFAQGVASLQDLGYQLFLEIGPTPTLASLAKPALRGGAATIASMRRNAGQWTTMLEALAGLYVRGVEIDWAGFDRGYGRRRLALPTYPFERTRHWTVHSGSSRPGRQHSAAAGGHPLLGVRLSSALRDAQWQSELSAESPTYLADHVKRGEAVYPATAYLEMGLTAAREVLGTGTHVFEELIISDPLVLARDITTVQTIVTPESATRATFRLFSRTGTADVRAGWRLHGEGTLSLQPAAGREEAERLELVRARCVADLPIDRYYARLLADGHDYGPAFRGITRLWGGDNEALARIELPPAEARQADAYRVHPALLDAAMQALAAGSPGYIDSAARDETFLPVSLGRCRVLIDGSGAAWSHIRLRDVDADGFMADVRLYDDEGRVVAEVMDVYHRRIAASSSAVAAATASWLYEFAWRAKARDVSPARGMASGSWLIAADSENIGRRFAECLNRQGVTTTVITTSGNDDTGAIRTLIDTANTELAGIVHVAGPDAADQAAAADAAVPARLRRSAASILETLQAVIGGERKALPRLWIVTHGAVAVESDEGVSIAQAPLWGLARTIAAEHPELRCSCIDLDPTNGAGDVGAACAEMLEPDSEDQIAFRGGQRHVARLVRSTSAARVAAAGADRVQSLEIVERGLLERLELQPADRRQPGPGEVEVRVAAAGLNFRDVLNALGMYAGAGALGGECAGTVVSIGDGVTGLSVGDEVIGMALGAFRSYVTAPAAGFVRRPANLSLETAATIPVAFLTAEYALNDLAGMKAGDRVLIHAAAGGVGLAAVRLAQRAGATVFATAGSAEKHAFLRAMGVEHVMSSRSLDFAATIRDLTHGEGVDIVLNSLAGDFIPQSVSALRHGGRFLEIGRAGIWTHEEMAAARPDVEYHTILLRHDALDVIQPLLKRLAEAFATGGLEPLPVRTFPIADAVQAFRFMAQARHIGKIVLTFDSPPQVAMSAAATYLITGGTGALGLQVARGLIDEGARHIVLVSRRLPAGDARRAVDALKGSGADVRVVQADVAREAEVVALLAKVAAEMPPLKGVVHAAGVLDDGVLLQQTWARFEGVLAPKVAGAWHLHRLTNNLDFFVMFSSMVALFGGTGQGNYATANAFLEGLASHRRARGLPALTLAWGPWAGAGMTAAVGERDRQRWRDQGFGFIAPADGVRLLNQLLKIRTPARLAVLPIDWRLLLEPFAVGAEPPFLAEMAAGRGVSSPRRERRDLAAEVAAVAPNLRRNMVFEFTHDETRKVLGLEASASVDARQPLRELGLDSLMAVELRNAIANAIGTTLPATLLFKHPTLESLAGFVMAQLGIDARSAHEAEPAIDREAVEVASLSDEETRSQLAEEIRLLSQN